MLLARVNDLSAVAVAIGLTKINFRIVTVFGRRLSWIFWKIFGFANYFNLLNITSSMSASIEKQCVLFSVISVLQVGYFFRGILGSDKFQKKRFHVFVSFKTWLTESFTGCWNHVIYSPKVNLTVEILNCYRVICCFFAVLQRTEKSSDSAPSFFSLE